MKNGSMNVLSSLSLFLSTYKYLSAHSLWILLYAATKEEYTQVYKDFSSYRKHLFN